MCPNDAHTLPGFDPQAVNMDWDTDGGWTLGGGVGRYSGLFGGSRFELEGTYLSNSVDGMTYHNFQLPANFDLDTTAVMVNYLKEVPLGRCTGYFGGGIGWGWTSMDGDVDTILYSDPPAVSPGSSSPVSTSRSRNVSPSSPSIVTSSSTTPSSPRTSATSPT